LNFQKYRDRIRIHLFGKHIKSVFAVANQTEKTKAKMAAATLDYNNLNDIDLHQIGRDFITQKNTMKSQQPPHKQRQMRRPRHQQKRIFAGSAKGSLCCWWPAAAIFTLVVSDYPSMNSVVVTGADAFLLHNNAVPCDRRVSLSAESTSSSSSPSSSNRHHLQLHHQNDQPYSSSSSSTSSSHTLNFVERWCTTHLGVCYERSLTIKCPFLRRRSTDVLDGLESIMRFVIVRHKSLPLIGPPLAWSSSRLGGLSTMTANSSSSKTELLPPEVLMDVIQNDWKPSTSKGYYLTGRLTQSIYRDDCLFDGPDPDMPVRGLHKYLNAASQLFETKSSTAELLDLRLVTITEVQQQEPNNYDDEMSSCDFVSSRSMDRSISQLLDMTVKAIKTSAQTVAGSLTCSQKGGAGEEDIADFVVVAEWRLQGVLHLPWHPKLPTWTGRTTYHFDSQHLVKRHEEEWDISVLQAFTQTLWPQLGNKIWNQHDQQPS
jgi:hypothetical protein